MKKQQGFNLVELMIVVAIVGIIVAFAYPSYQEQTRKTRRADCSGALASFASTMERYYTVNNTYAGAGAAGGDTGTPTIFAASCPVDGGAATYDLTIEAANASTFEIRATPVGVQANDKCGTLTLTNTGLKGITGAATGMTRDKCW
ncbi:MAG: prepilin-type N-terminal cleavage/methylation domain-containing protein [Gammaproteobacteria bacterium]|nr:prepilin-type N-terminal cleavage/methylation domain-containing protein [Gammaproteobacteria bacterium]NNL44338.1 prepilin-type N-terminal cleavage/methylation domain-containing protein [Woeseiaceae bacterium]